MRVAINGYFWDQPHTGSGQYLRRLWRALGTLPESAPHQFILLLPPGARTPADLREASFGRPNGRVVVATARAPFIPRAGNLGQLWWEQVGLPRAARRARADVLHCPYLAAPLVAPCPLVVTVHDLIPWVLPAYRASRAVRLYLGLARLACGRARLILADSECSRRDVLRFFGLPPTRVRTVLLGIEPEAGAPVDADALAAVRARFALPEHYAFYIGGFDARKDVPLLLRAWSAALPHLRDGVEQPVLAIAGRLPQPGGLYPDLPALASRLGLSAEGPDAAVRFLGRVSEEDKHSLLAGARLFAFPSRYEGFGYDPLEAMAAGAPVLCANSSSLPEIVGDAGVLLPPGDLPAWTAALTHVWHDAALRADLTARGRSRAATLDPRTTAAQTLHAYQDAHPPTRHMV